MKFRHSVSALTLTLALASPLVLAQGHRGGGSRGGHGGGGGGGGSHAVPRGSGGGGGGKHYGSRPGHAAPRGAEGRHPRAGTGHGYRYGSGYYGGHRYGRGYGYGYGYGYGRGYGYYRPYYGYGYPYYSYPYYSYASYPYSYAPGVSLSLGLGYSSSEPYYAGGDYGSVSGDDGGAAPPAREARRSYDERSGRVRLEVRPEDASVYVDDAFRGTAREARSLNLSPGRHQIELVRPGFATERREVTVETGQSQDLFVELVRP